MLTSDLASSLSRPDERHYQNDQNDEPFYEELASEDQEDGHQEPFPNLLTEGAMLLYDLFRLFEKLAWQDNSINDLKEKLESLRYLPAPEMVEHVCRILIYLKCQVSNASTLTDREKCLIKSFESQWAKITTNLTPAFLRIFPNALKDCQKCVRAAINSTLASIETSQSIALGRFLTINGMRVQSLQSIAWAGASKPVGNKSTSDSFPSLGTHQDEVESPQAHFHLPVLAPLKAGVTDFDADTNMTSIGAADQNGDVADVGNVNAEALRTTNDLPNEISSKDQSQVGGLFIAVTPDEAAFVCCVNSGGTITHRLNARTESESNENMTFDAVKLDYVPGATIDLFPVYLPSEANARLTNCEPILIDLLSKQVMNGNKENPHPVDTHTHNFVLHLCGDSFLSIWSKFHEKLEWLQNSKPSGHSKTISVIAVRNRKKSRYGLLCDKTPFLKLSSRTYFASSKGLQDRFLVTTLELIARQLRKCLRQIGYQIIDVPSSLNLTFESLPNICESSTASSSIDGRKRKAESEQEDTIIKRSHRDALVDARLKPKNVQPPSDELFTTRGRPHRAAKTDAVTKIRNALKLSTS